MADKSDFQTIKSLLEQIGYEIDADENSIEDYSTGIIYHFENEKLIEIENLRASELEDEVGYWMEFCYGDDE